MLHLLAPTEHDLHGIFRSNGSRISVSSVPERHGCDVVSVTKAGLIGYQRKTLPDLQSSLLDGRLYYELAQMESSASISHIFLIIESELRRTIDGSLIDSTLTIEQLRSIIAKFSAFGVGYLPSANTEDTFRCVTNVSRYIASGDITAIRRPKQLTNDWGTITSDSYALYLLQSFPGIGPTHARNIHAKFGGVPLQWTITADDLATVKGIGKKKAADLIKALTPIIPK